MFTGACVFIHHKAAIRERGEQKREMAKKERKFGLLSVFSSSISCYFATLLTALLWATNGRNKDKMKERIRFQPNSQKWQSKIQ